DRRETYGRKTRGEAAIGREGTGSIPDWAWVHGNVGNLWRFGRERERRHDSRGGGTRHQFDRHRRFLRHGSQRNAGGPRVEGAARQGAAFGEVWGAASAGWKLAGI